MSESRFQQGESSGSRPGPVSGLLIGRLSLYRRLLDELLAQGVKHFYSHQLAASVGGSAAQVRRDLMTIGFSGSPAKGYQVGQLLESVSRFIDAPEEQRAVLVGVGNLGRAVLSYFVGRRPLLGIVAAFDLNPEKTNRVTHGCRCHPMEQLRELVSEQGASVGIITVPAAHAQSVADQLVEAGVRALVNFAPVRLKVSHQVFVEQIDITTSLEKAAYFARTEGWSRSTRR